MKDERGKRKEEKGQRKEETRHSTERMRGLESLTEDSEGKDDIQLSFHSPVA